MSGRVACPHCGAVLRAGSEFCPSCLGAVPPSAALVDLPEGELPATEAPAIPDLDPNPVPLASIKREGGVDAAGKRFLFQLGALVFFMIGAMVVGAGLHDVGPIAV